MAWISRYCEERIWDPPRIATAGYVFRTSTRTTW
jgi:hypothetical protein